MKMRDRFSNESIFGHPRNGRALQNNVSALFHRHKNHVDEIVTYRFKVENIDLIIHRTKKEREKRKRKISLK